MTLIEENHPEFKELSKEKHIGIYVYNKERNDFLRYAEKTWISFEEEQKYFDCVYATNPDFLLNKKIQIPYFYNIKPQQGLKYKEFNDYYSELIGASAVFVDDSFLNKYSCWLGLNSFWVNSATFPQKYIPKKFRTPKLHIGYVYDGNENAYNLVKKLVYLKKSNWVFHIYQGNKHDINNEVFYDGDGFESKMFENIHILLDIPDYALDKWPNSLCSKAMSSGVVVLSKSLNHNNTHIIFDKTHYFKLEYCSAESISEVLKYCDKRREKLEKVSIEGSQIIKKYFDPKDIVSQKIRIIESCL